MAKFQIKRAVNNQFYWLLKAANGEEIAKSSEYYVSKQGAKDSVDWMRKYTAGADAEDLT